MSENDSTSKEKPKRTLTKLTLGPSETGKAIDIRELEKRAIWAEKEVAGVHYKMRELYPTLHGIHDHFTNNVRGSVTFRGCHTWNEYCVKKLHCTRQAVFMMEKRIAARKVETKKQPPKRREAPGILDSPKKQEAARLALSAVNQYRTAKTTEEKTAAWAEYVRIADEGLQSVIGDDDQPHYMLMLLDLVVMTERLVAALNALNPVLEDVDKPILAAARSCAEQAAKYCAAVRRRLNRPASVVKITEAA